MLTCTGKKKYAKEYNKYEMTSRNILMHIEVCNIVGVIP